MRLILLLLLGGWLLAAPAQGAIAPVEVEVTRDGARWTALFTLPAAAPAWVFARSPVTERGRQPWRIANWTVETPGVSLVRQGHHDLLVATGGGPVPRRVRIGFTPFAGRVVADYDPALVFTDGTVALYSDQFDLLPLTRRDAARRFPPDLASADLPAQPTRLRLSDRAGPVLHAGQRRDRVVIDGEARTYVLFGPAPAVPSAALTLIMDPQLPAWLAEEIGRTTPRLLELYAASLGPAPGGRPTIIVSWAGPGVGLSMGGGTLPGLIVMRFEGARLLQPDRLVAETNLWFIAHEAAHFWLGEAITYDHPREAWITEGGADLLAVRAMAAIDPAFDARRRLQGGISQCAELTRGRALSSALERDEHQAYYACGLVFGLVAEAVTGRPFADFVRQLIERHGADRRLGRADWLDSLSRAGAPRPVVADIERLIDRGAERPGAVIASLFEHTGIAFAAGDDGVPRL